MVTADEDKLNMATEVDDEKIDIENSEEEEVEDEGNRADSPVSSLSLDVLAQVASDRLQTDSGKTSLKVSLKNKGSKKTPKRALQSLDRLNLQQIKSLSNKLLVSLFSEMSSDELRRQYTLTCLLEPEVCSQKVTVYGNEMKAKIEMQRHLTTHLTSLASKYKDDPESYVAETLPGRKKKLFAKKKWELKDKRKKKGSGSSPYPSTYNAKYRRGRPPMFPQTLHDYAGLGYEIDKEELEESAKVKDFMKTSDPDSYQTNQGDEKTFQSVEHSQSMVNLMEIHSQGDRTDQTEEENEEQEDSETETNEDDKSTEAELDKEALILKLLEKSQPYADHNYTSILGKKRGIESMQFEDSEDEGERSFTSTLTKGQLYSLIPDKINKDDKPPITVKISGEPGKDPTMLHVPILKLPPIPIQPKRDFLAKHYQQQENEPTPEEQVLEALTRLAEKMTEQKKVYPPMPSPCIEKQGLIPEELILNPTAEEAVVNKDANPYKRGRRGYETTSGEWERKAALKCIKELRLKKKFEPSLVCKICKDKTFTATATLMYHYRSHAGIKPFVCLICNTTFTRQHSLNYHMLIHNNQSRFTCKECGRKFRHPSHFKEHMRRHTGETPYHCTDCPLRFKTRNTYKRHLRTRHDKLLTVLGIRFMTQEEIARNDSLQESEKEDVDDSTESDTSLEEHKNNQTKPVPIQPKPPNEQQSSNEPTTTEEKPKVTITDDSPLGQIQSIESTSSKISQNAPAVASPSLVIGPTHPTVTAVKLEPSLFVTQALLSGSVSGTGVFSTSGNSSGVMSSAATTQMVSATPTIQLQVPTLMATAHHHQQQPQQAQTLNIATLPRIQLLTASGQPIQIPQLVQTTPSAVAQLTPAVGPQLVLAAPPQMQAPTLNITTQNSGNLVGTNGIINVPLNQTTFHVGTIGGQNTLQTALHPGGISLLTVPGNPANTTNAVTLQMKTDSSSLVLANNPQTVSYATTTCCNSGITKVTATTSTGSGGATILQSNTPDTPAANTLLKFCTQVANQVGQVIPSNI